MMPANRIAAGPNIATAEGRIAGMAVSNLRKSVQFLGAVEYLDPEVAGPEAAKLRAEAEALGRKLRRFAEGLGVDPGAPFPWEVSP